MACLRRAKWFRKVDAATGAGSGDGRPRPCAGSHAFVCGLDPSGSGRRYHFSPKADYPGRAFLWENHLLACSHCNSNEKRTQFPLDPSGNPLLLDPTASEPTLDLVLVPETGRFIGITDRGRETIEVFGLNRNESLRKGRKDTWQLLLKIVRDIGRAAAAQDTAAIQRELKMARRLSFQSVTHHLVVEALRPAQKLVPADVARTIETTRDHWRWAI